MSASSFSSRAARLLQIALPFQSHQSQAPSFYNALSLASSSILPAALVKPSAVLAMPTKAMAATILWKIASVNAKGLENAITGPIITWRMMPGFTLRLEHPPGR